MREVKWPENIIGRSLASFATMLFLFLASRKIYILRANIYMDIIRYIRETLSDQGGYLESFTKLQRSNNESSMMKREIMETR